MSESQQGYQVDGGGSMLVPRRTHKCGVSVENVCEPIHLCASEHQAGLTGE